LAVRKELEAPAGAPAAQGHATLDFKSDVGDTFRLVDAHFVMDGNDLPAVINTAERGKSYVIFSGDVSSGHHTVTAQLTYKGANHGVFSYMNGYTFKVASDEVLTTPSDQPMTFTIVCKQRTGFNDAVDKPLVVTVEAHHGP
jgi:hypothetical protein